MILPGERTTARIRILGALQYVYEEHYDEEQDDYFESEYTIWHLPDQESTPETPLALCGMECDEMAWFERRLIDHRFHSETNRWDRQCVPCKERFIANRSSLPSSFPPNWTQFSARSFLQGDDWEPRLQSPPNGQYHSVGVPEAYWSGMYLSPSARTEWNLLTPAEQRQALFAGTSIFNGGRYEGRTVFNITRGASGEGPIFLT